MRARGFQPGFDRHTLRTFGYLVGMLLVRASERAERVLKAMRCRGFTGEFPILVRSRLGPADALGALTMAGALVTLVLLEQALGPVAGPR